MQTIKNIYELQQIFANEATAYLFGYCAYNESLYDVLRAKYKK